MKVKKSNISKKVLYKNSKNLEESAAEKSQNLEQSAARICSVLHVLYFKYHILFNIFYTHILSIYSVLCSLLYVIIAEYSLFYRALLQKRPITRYVVYIYYTMIVYVQCIKETYQKEHTHLCIYKHTQCPHLKTCIFKN